VRQFSPLALVTARHSLPSEPHGPKGRLAQPSRQNVVWRFDEGEDHLEREPDRSAKFRLGFCIQEFLSICQHFRQILLKGHFLRFLQCQHPGRRTGDTNKFIHPIIKGRAGQLLSFGDAVSLCCRFDGADEVLGEFVHEEQRPRWNANDAPLGACDGEPVNETRLAVHAQAVELRMCAHGIPIERGDFIVPSLFGLFECRHCRACHPFGHGDKLASSRAFGVSNDHVCASLNPPLEAVFKHHVGHVARYVGRVGANAGKDAVDPVFVHPVKAAGVLTLESAHHSNRVLRIADSQPGAFALFRLEPLTGRVVAHSCRRVNGVSP